MLRGLAMFPQPPFLLVRPCTTSVTNTWPFINWILGRDRSGSYSPYLSPHEMDHLAMAASVNGECD